MNDYKQNSSETKIDEREGVGCLAQYNPEESESVEQDETASTMPHSRREENLLSALTEPEDWGRGYD